MSIILLITLLLACLKIYTEYYIRKKTIYTDHIQYKDPDTTELYILGTIHNTTEQINYDDLYNVLELIKPNIILFERDSLGFDSEMNLKSKWWRMKFPDFFNKYNQNYLEEIAVRKYVHHNKNTIVRPYEWSQRDKFHERYKILTIPDMIFQKLYNLYMNDSLNHTQKNILDQFYYLSNQLNKFSDSTLYEINTDFQDSIAKYRQNLYYHEIKQIIDSNDNLKEFRAFYKVNEKYWDIRNLAMVRNIEKYIEIYPKSRIVVLNGYYHRYYLRNELQKKQTELNFKIKDIEK